MMSNPVPAAKNTQALASAARSMTEAGDTANRADAVERRMATQARDEWTHQWFHRFSTRLSSKINNMVAPNP